MKPILRLSCCAMLGRMADLHQQEETEVNLLQEREDEESEEEAQKLVGLVGYAFEPVIARADLDDGSGESESCSESEPEHDRDNGDPGPEYRLDSTDWCICQNCTLISTVKESTCCHEVPGVQQKLHGDDGKFSCIIANPRFYWICLDSEQLEVAMLSIADLKAERLQGPITSRQANHTWGSKVKGEGCINMLCVYYQQYKF